ncbi:hypothetical protein NFI96_006416 [Prochilodus magdalenae]|nr:hypothetical protein NFI96_006416 [Prochilodus magdalenae]
MCYVLVTHGDIMTRRMSETCTLEAELNPNMYKREIPVWVITLGLLEGVNQTDGCLQSSCPERSAPTALYVFLYVCAAAVVLLTVCGNLLIIISVGYFKQLHTPTNMLILSLAVSDLLVGLFVMPFHFLWLIESCWIFGHVFCVLFNFVSFQLTSVSVGNVALIALDRYVALSHPFLYSKDSTATVVHTVILLTWLFSLVYNLAMFYVGGNFTDLVMCPGECLYFLGEADSFVDLLFVVIVPCTLMVVLYVQVFVIARKHANAIRELNQNFKSFSKITSDSMRSERKAARVLGVLVVVFLACLVPYYACSLMTDTVTSDSSYLVVNNVLILFYLNSSINPLIYALFYSWFQRCTRMILSCKILHTDCSFANVLRVNS